MFLAALLGEKGYKPERISAAARVHLGAGPLIKKIELECEAEVPGVSEEEFRDLAVKAKEGCPVSKALMSVPEITLDARLAG
jgi:osmotically inducible protein OsmC